MLRSLSGSEAVNEPLLRDHELKAPATPNLMRLKALFAASATIARQSGTRRCLI
jgi:hypothetical protein